MGKLFGTDGIRGVANKELSTDLAYKTGLALGHSIMSRNLENRVIIGRDTRISGTLIESAMVSGLMSMGVNVDIGGVMPTPCVAYLTRNFGYGAGVVISASHNPYYYNGIKIFSNDGYKLPDDVEEGLEDLILSDTKIYNHLTHDKIGILNYRFDIKNEYVNYLKNTVNLDLHGLKIGIDAGNGALYEIAKTLLCDLGADIIVINDSPNGCNINLECGSTNSALIKNLVIEKGLDMGMSFDGDADRIIAVDDNGDEVDGDHILAICATYLKDNNKLKNNTVVGTIMSNIGLRKYLSSIGVELINTKVGDRYVIEEMKKNDFILGGEQSGHIIFLDYNTTGDGLATGLHLLEVMKKTGKKLSELNKLMTSYPQVLVNAKVRGDLKHKYMDFDDVVSRINELESSFMGSGRVVIRPSGTEDLVRVMIEGEDRDFIEKKAVELANFIEERLG